MSTPPPRLSMASKLWYGVGYLPDSIMNNLFYALVFVVYQIELGISGTIIGSAMMVSRLWEAFIDPFFGNLSDRTRSRWGRRRPYMVAGAILGGLMCYALWTPPQEMSKENLGWYFGGVAILFYTAYAIYSVPFMALGLGMSSNDQDRTSLFGWRVAANNLVCCTLVPAAPLLVYNKWLGDTPLTSLSHIGLIAGLMIIGFGILAAMKISEHEAPTVNKGHESHVGMIDGFKCVMKSAPFLMTTGIVSFTIIGMCAAGNLTLYLNLTNVYPGGTEVEKKLATELSAITGTFSAVLGLLFAPLVSTISGKMGRKAMLMTAIFGIMGAFLLSPILFNKTYPYLQLVFATMTNLCVTAVWVLTLPMLADACDYDEIQNGIRREGIFTAMYNWGIKVAVAMIGVMSGLVIDNSGFVATLAEQSESTKAILTWSFALGPIPFFAACAIMTWYFPLSAEKIQLMRDERATKTTLSH